MRSTFAFIVVSLYLSLSGIAQAQSEASKTTGETRSRAVTSLPAEQSASDTENQSKAPSNAQSPQRLPGNPAPRVETQRLTDPVLIKSRITEAERFLKTRPKQTAAITASPAIDIVTLAAVDPVSSRIHLIPLSKQSFLTRGIDLPLITSLGTPVTIHILRANGVNTAVTVIDNAGNSFLPLVVEYPIEHGGVFREMAYYTSAHPALLSPDLVRTGQTYVHSMIDLAAKRLREKGTIIAPGIVDVAEHLCLVEHVDHDRFRGENRSALFNEVYSLYALNEIDTYRYSVSFAGAGGMVQMIPWAYNLIRQRHPGVGLMPDFVAGMRNHGNALQAMLLYMQDTWNELAVHEDVRFALDNNLATQTELLAAGYNSNAAKLPLYLRRGGSNWRTLIPRETQMYLQIYKSVELLVPMKARATM